MSLLAQLLFEADDLKRQALELQAALLEHPYGDYLNIELINSPLREPSIAIKISDELSNDSDKDVAFVLTEKTVYGPTQRWRKLPYDSLTMFSSNDSFEDVKPRLISVIMGRFVIESYNISGDTFFRSMDVIRAQERDLVLLLKQTGELYKLDALAVGVKRPKLTNISAGQSFVCKAKAVNSPVLTFEKVTYDDETFNNFTEAMAHFKVGSVRELLNLEHGSLALLCKDAATGKKVKLLVKSHGKDAQVVFYMNVTCSLLPIVKVR